jgi:hypothetical protein
MPTDPKVRNATITPKPYGDLALATLLNWLPFAKDQSVKLDQSWEIHTLDSAQMAGANTCIGSGSGLAGLVSTNSTTYSAGPPAFSSGSLTYKVTSPHYAPDHTAFVGTYDLIIRSDVARCLYKFTSAPMSASISVVSNDGVEQNATTTFFERDGWVKFAAHGFNFSAPTIAVKLSQAAATPAPTAKTTISCVKGKVVKKVTAVAPKCPAGFKKKA